ncbi:NAD binding 4 domain containing protein [Asbolus verrucosus]|uniref:Fatty acyl-CoA reductase n=1 Tax=Asbolus verrucosus TaxID=1661398 RepID=A0A482VWT0_ASBVE|nr:NAD binding 4 domain containing protein [Asbolus verrucosus]
MTMTSKSNIKEFFQDQTIFLTGGSGFLGKVLIEKLLRECYNLTKIYVMMRPKKGKNAKERFDGFFDQPCFDLIKSKGINFTEKVFLINGNCEEPLLGLSETDIDVLKKEVPMLNLIRLSKKLLITFEPPKTFWRWPNKCQN